MIVGIVSVFFTALFTGIPAVLLFWWTWQRDQERLVVQKLLMETQTVSGGSVLERDQLGPTFGILIRNCSLFPVHVSAVGYKIDGNVLPLEHPIPPSKMKPNPDPHSNRPYILDDTFDPWQIPSQASMRVQLSNGDRLKIVPALLTASERLGLSVEDLLRGPKVEALVASETGKEFTSLSFRARVKHLFEKACYPRKPWRESSPVMEV